MTPPMEMADWREEAGGMFVAEMACFTLIVHRRASRHNARFCVLGRRQPDGADTLVGSGATVDDIPAAMNAAEKMAERLW
jgi:hypothetical protein